MLNYDQISNMLHLIVISLIDMRFPGYKLGVIVNLEQKEERRKGRREETKIKIKERGGGFTKI